MKTLDALIATLKQAQEELAKAIKPGPTLDYSQINKKPDRAAIEAAAPTIDYGGNRMAAPKYAGAKERAEAVRTKLETEANEPAIDTINRRQKTFKNENASYSAPANTVEQSDKEPHKDNPEHEAKEKVKAKKIKKEAEDLLDMHKADGAPPPPPPVSPAAQSIMNAFKMEDLKCSENGQWHLKKDNSVKPFGQNIYNTAANIKRKANRTGEEVEGVGRNAAVHNYTTLGSSMSAAHEASQAKSMKAKAKANLKVYTPEEKAAFAAARGEKATKE